MCHYTFDTNVDVQLSQVLSISLKKLTTVQRIPTARSIQIVSHFKSRTLTPQVSYMKAIDLWVLGCIFFVFSTLAEYGLVLYLTSRSAWQKRVDTFIKENTSEMSEAVKLKIIRLLQVEKKYHNLKNKQAKLGVGWGAYNNQGKQIHIRISNPKYLHYSDFIPSQL